MKFKYFNYLVPILVLHVLALFGRLISFPDNTQNLGRGKPSVLNTQIQRSEQIAVKAKKVFTKNLPSQKKIEDQKVISEDSSTTPVPSGNVQGQADIKNQYFADLKAHIEQHKHYPIMSRRLGQTGRVVVAFTLHGDGSFTNIHVHQSCPFERLNVAALDAVKRVGRFRPIPKEINTGFLDIQVPIEYQTVN